MTGCWTPVAAWAVLLFGWQLTGVTGISLNENQVRKATAFAQEAGLQNQVTFAQRNYLDTGYPSESFDVVRGIESVCYADDKSAFLNEAARLLRKGGRLVMADFFRQKTFRKRQRLR